jgi:LysM repeat protein
MRLSTTWKRTILSSVFIGAVLLPTSIASAKTITVKAGDTLGDLAVRYQLTVDHLKIANHLKSDLIYQGTTLYLPPPSTI